jgi:hypothetical protein
MGYRSLRGTARTATFDKARWVGTPPRYRIDHQLVIHLVQPEDEPDRADPKDGAGPRPDSDPKG